MTDIMPRDDVQKLLDGTTPGPWTAEREGSFDRRTIYGVTEDCVQFAVARAVEPRDAHLIAAAPDLARSHRAVHDEIDRLRADAQAAVALVREISASLHQTARDRDLTEGELAFMRRVDAILAALTPAEQAHFDLTMRIRGAAGDIAKAQIAAREDG